MSSQSDIAIHFGSIALGLALASCTAHAEPGPKQEESTMKATSTEQTRTAARRFYETLNTAMRTVDTSVLDEVVAVDAVDHNPVPNMKPGRAGIAEAFLEMRAWFPDVTFTVEDVVAEGDKAAVRFTIRGTHRGAMHGIQPTGKKVVIKVIDVLRFDGQQLRERWGESDRLSLYQQLGVDPPRG
jgi:predicted ester cyclase